MKTDVKPIPPTGILGIYTENNDTVFITRDNRKVKLIRYDKYSSYPFRFKQIDSNSTFTTTLSGYYWSDVDESPDDIVGYEQPEKQPPQIETKTYTTGTYRTRDGRKAEVVVDLSKNFPDKCYPLLGTIDGMMARDGEPYCWAKRGTTLETESLILFDEDLVGPWVEEPVTETITYNGKTFHPVKRPVKNETYYYIRTTPSEVGKSAHWGDTPTDNTLINLNLVYRTEEEKRHANI